MIWTSAMSICTTHIPIKCGLWYVCAKLCGGCTNAYADKSAREFKREDEVKGHHHMILVVALVTPPLPHRWSHRFKASLPSLRSLDRTFSLLMQYPCNIQPGSDEDKLLHSIDSFVVIWAALTEITPFQSKIRKLDGVQRLDQVPVLTHSLTHFTTAKSPNLPFVTLTLIVMEASIKWLGITARTLQSPCEWV